jgi:carboxyl-terminal processing protease
LTRSYYRPVDREKALEGASRGVVSSLGDPYSSYMSKREWEEFQVRTSGAYSGIGVTIDVRDKYVRIATPMKGSPAEEAGLRADDLILQGRRRTGYDQRRSRGQDQGAGRHAGDAYHR